MCSWLRSWIVRRLFSQGILSCCPQLHSQAAELAEVALSRANAEREAAQQRAQELEASDATLRRDAKDLAEKAPPILFPVF